MRCTVDTTVVHYRPRSWPAKADLYLVRTDGMSCARETVRGLMRVQTAAGCYAAQRVVHKLAVRQDVTSYLFATAASGCLSFSCPSTQQHLLVWKTKPSWLVMSTCTVLDF